MEINVGDVILLRFNGSTTEALVYEKLDTSSFMCAYRYYDRWAYKHSNVKFPYFSGMAPNPSLTKQEVFAAYQSLFYRNNGSDLLLGSDPEFFCVDGNGVVIPAFTFLPSAKDQKNIYYPYWDGFQAEFRIEPAVCLEVMANFFHRGIENLQSHLPPFKGKITSSPVVDIPVEFLLRAADEHVQLGCAPSRNAYGDERIPPVDGRLLNWRCAGAHQHFGLGKLDIEEANEYVKLLDASAGLVGVVLCEEDQRRRELYGKAGEYRLPKHGLEYRVLSSAIMKHPVRWFLCMDMGRYLVRLHHAGMLELAGFKFNPQDVKKVINSGDIAGARELLAVNEGFWREFFKEIYTSDLPWRWLMGKKKLKFEDDVVGNWQHEDITDKVCSVYSYIEQVA